MTPEDKQAFMEILSAAYELHGKSITEGAIKLWWNILKGYDLEQVSQALSQLSATEKFLPMPAQVIDILEPSGWPSPAEAWSMAPLDERGTYAVHDELQAAWSAAAGLWETGDTIGARRAFEGAYQRICDAARLRGVRRPMWRLSIGWNESLRSAGAQLAVDRGLLKAETVAGYLEHEDAEAKPLLGHGDESDRRGDVRPLRRILGGADGGRTGIDVSSGAQGVGGREAAGELDTAGVPAEAGEG